MLAFVPTSDRTTVREQLNLTCLIDQLPFAGPTVAVRAAGRPFSSYVMPLHVEMR